MTNNTLSTVHTIEDLRRIVTDWRMAGDSVGLVPTMGALHEGHLSLVVAALERCDKVIATIFVNPTQFGENEDFDAYPRVLADDTALLTEAGAHLLFTPSVSEMYSSDFTTSISVAGVSEPLEGAHRPGHFDGVATVVAKLLLQCLPDAAFFGEKDFQQLAVIRRMAIDLNIPCAITGVETVRAADGLALSSRNAYLSTVERDIAPSVYRVLNDIVDAMRQGGDAEALEAWGQHQLLEAGFSSIDYIAIRDAETLGSYQRGRSGRVLAAAKLGKARLIDNIAL